ncbi:rabenosyn-5-like [Ylistrum balloti]|uniref:rabenosyn-5-like n=1 Tax=Ylistrum balloti TaxID=509963 RepID=UPI002905C767|nr:rabenosyn-5-like [Ylistrum balloti]XP_060079178.1 rabenosyn-5-like [Ylistrum balloti]
MATAAEVREGFLCPMCMKDLGTISQLQGHFEEEHSAEDKDVLQQLRGLFGKTIKKILGDKDTPNNSEVASSSSDNGQQGYIPAPSVAGYDPSLWDPQEPGHTRSWTDTFKTVRGTRVDRFVVETNKLIIRLDKLTGQDAPSEPSKRKAYERALVPWLPDKMIPSCPTCGRTFGLTRRRHHCRLCGDIMCDKCSHFMPYTFAKKLTDPAFQTGGEVGFLKRSGSNTSLNSLMGMDGDPHIRTCENCRKLLERRDQQMEQRNTQPPIVLLYQKMSQYVDNSNDLLAEYMPMVESLSNGESTHNLQSAQQLRAKILKTYELIDGLSKRILQLGMNSEEGPTAKQVQLQKAIRMRASNVMQENVIGLQALPTEEQYAVLQERRKQQVQRRIALERQATLEAQEREMKQREQKEQKDQPSKPAAGIPAGPPSGKVKTKDGRDRSGSQILSGWIPSESTINFNDKDDPMIQQMNIIRGYIKQAKQAQKLDEVTMLEQNLKELGQEYLRQQNQS